MQLNGVVETYLQRHRIAYEVFSHEITQSLAEAAEAAGVPLNSLARAVLLQGTSEAIMVVLPATHLLDFAALRAVAGPDVEPAPSRLVAEVFADCEPGSVPPLPEPYHLKGVIDEALSNLEEVFFEPGSHDCLVKISGDDFRRLHTDSLWGIWARRPETISSHNPEEFVVPDSAEKIHHISDLRPLKSIRERISQVKTLPAMPEMAHRLMRLRNNPRATIAELAEIASLDPSLTAQIIRYARSPFFGYRGQVETVHDAITRVLGFDMVMTMALGLATGRTLRNPPDGPLGLKSFWKHAIYTAALAQALNGALPATIRQKPGLVYLTGLLHDFGFLLLGHLFKPEFFLLNRLVAANPDVPVTLIEKRILGVSHTQVGAWLMKAWNMPEEVVVTVREHHNEYYQGEHAVLANLVLLADHLLKEYSFSDAASTEPPSIILTNLGLGRDKALGMAHKMLESAEGLDAMAQQFAA